MKRVGIYGGTFDPVHNGHLRVARIAVEQLNLDKLIIMPAGIPPHKTGEMISENSDRLEMCKLAFNQPIYEVSDFEMKKGGKSYTYQTVELLKREDEQLFLIIGGDSLYHLHTWKNPEYIVNNAHIFAVGRLDDGEQTEFMKAHADKITVCDLPTGDESSTYLRVLRQFGEDISAFVPKEIDRFVVEKGLYRSFSPIVEEVRRRLTPKRFKHTFGVTLCASKLNGEANVEEEKAFIAALLHDVAKYADKETIKKYEKELEGEGVYLPDPVLHAFLGSYIARDEFGITDEEILSAIKYHCTGKPDMSGLEKLIYLADGIEQGRDFDGVEALREITRESFEEGFKAFLLHTSAYIENKDVCPLTRQAVEYYRN